MILIGKQTFEHLLFHDNWVNIKVRTTVSSICLKPKKSPDDMLCIVFLGVFFAFIAFSGVRGYAVSQEVL